MERSLVVVVRCFLATSWLWASTSQGGDIPGPPTVSVRDNSRWWGFGTPEENGLPGSVGSFTEYDGRLVAVGGFFQSSGMHCIGAWDGATWTQLGAGVYMRHPAEPCDNYCLAAIASAVGFQDELVVGGAFRYAGGYFARHRANNVAKWDGETWQALGAGVDGAVRELIVHEDNVVAIGSFSTAGELPAAGIARWNGASWTPMDAGFVGPRRISLFGATNSLDLLIHRLRCSIGMAASGSR